MKSRCSSGIEPHFSLQKRCTAGNLLHRRTTDDVNHVPPGSRPLPHSPHAQKSRQFDGSWRYTWKSSCLSSFPLCRHWRQWRSLFCFCCFYSHLLHTYASPTPTFLLYNRNCIRTHHPLPPSYCTIESSLPYQGHSSHHHPSGTPFTFRDFVSSSFPRTKLAHGATKKIFSLAEKWHSARIGASCQLQSVLSSALPASFAAYAHTSFPHTLFSHNYTRIHIILSHTILCYFHSLFLLIFHYIDFGITL